MFQTYLQLGFEHITDLNGYDHMLFLFALCAAYQYFEWKKILVLVTAFTIGHSITLALSVLNIIPVNGDWIEFLIPVTIVATAAKNLLNQSSASFLGTSIERRNAPSPFQKGVDRSAQRSGRGIFDLTYIMALFFGLIHGMGFSNYLRSLLGDELLMPLFAFNIGIELGQLLVVLVIFLLQFALIKTISVKQQTWNWVVSLATGGISLLLAAQRIPF